MGHSPGDYIDHSLINLFPPEADHAWNGQHPGENRSSGSG